MNHPRSKHHQRFDREEAKRRHYIEQQRRQRNKYNGYHIPQKLNYDSPKNARKIRSHSNPDITEFYVPRNENRRPSNFLGVEREFDDGLSVNEFSMFEPINGNGNTRPSYASAKRDISRPQSAFSPAGHPPLKPMRSNSFGELEQIVNRTNPIYEPVELPQQLDTREDEMNPRNSLGNSSRGSGDRVSGDLSPKQNSLSDYDHLSSMLPQMYDRRLSHPNNFYDPYENHHPRKPSPPVMDTHLKRQRSRSFDINSSYFNGQYPGKTSYESDEAGRLRSCTDNWDSIDDSLDRRNGFVKIPGPGNENWALKKNYLDRGQQVEGPTMTPPIRQRTPMSPPRHPKPTPRRMSRDLVDGRDSPNKVWDDPMELRKPEENAYDNPVNALNSIPSIMVQPGTRPPTPDFPAKQEPLPERRPSQDQNFGFSPIDSLEREGIEQVPSAENENSIPSRPSTLTTNVTPPASFEGNGYYAAPSIAGTSYSRNTMGSDVPLTVENPPNKESEVREEEEQMCTNVYVITTKWFAVILTSLIVLFCVTANKVCLLVIGQEYSLLKDNATMSEAKKLDDNDRSKYSSRESIVIMLVVIIMAPQAISLFYGLWGKRKSQKWPKKTAVLWIIFGGTIEAFCLSFLCIYVLTSLSIQPSFFLLFISGLFVIPTIIQICQSAKKWETKKGKMRIVTFTIAAGMQIAGLILLVYTKKEMIELRAKIAVPLTIGLLSIAWSPKMRKLQTKPPTPLEVPKTAPNTPATLRHPIEDLNFREDDDIISVSPSFTLESQLPPPPPKKQAAREKAAIVMSVVQLIMTPVASVIFCKLLGIAQVEKIGEGFNLITVNHPAFYFFLTQIFVTFIGYHMAWLACSMYAQRPAFALPLTLATPLALVLIEIKGACENYSFISLKCGRHQGEEIYYLLAVAVLMLMGQFLSTGYYVWANMGYIMGKASHLFWLPSYTGVLLEPFLLLNRRNKVTDDKHVASKRLARDTYVFICTTMYHEVLEEMEQLLSSIHDIDVNFRRAGRHVESHIFFDGCIKAEVMNSYILQLASVIESTLEVKLCDACKVITPYGMQLQWTLPGGLPIIIHLKDNTKVKNKKRWSQVMYMSYVLDYKQRMLNVRDDQTFILTTDADVQFEHESMEALLDYMVQDDQIGAVCGRTHPLGNGPMVWYQIFDYAIGHWFMKVANHVFGSVLCCPGCFSLYRCQAVRDILPTYSTTVSEAFEFLTKDMGEDRWMCTLMVQAGWRLAYCAAAEDKTYCPQEFEEFYKQRRRWMPSTLANLALLVSEWRVVLKNNENISFPFILYQVVLLCATLIGPSIVILFIVGGLVNMGMNEVAAVTLLSGTTVMYGAVCYFFPQSTQITMAKFLTFIFAVIMIVVTIGLALQIKKELDDREELQEENRRTNGTLYIPFDKRLPAGISTLYLAGLSGIFIFAAFLHPKEALCLMNGIWYLLCLPSGYLLLTVYSVVNMTDRSWGTREGKKSGKEESPLDILWKNIKTKCVCCLKHVGNKEKEKEKENESKPSASSSAKGKFKRAFSRKSRKSVKSNGSGVSFKNRLRRVYSKDLDSEVGSESASEAHSVRNKDRLKQGSLGKIKLAIRDSLKGIGFFRHDGIPDNRLHMEDQNPMQPVRMPGKPIISVTTVPDNLSMDYDEEFRFPEMFGGLKEQLQRNADEGYGGNSPPLPALPINPLIHPQNGHENMGYEQNIGEFMPPLPTTGYPLVIEVDNPPTPNEREAGERPHPRKNSSPFYDTESFPVQRPFAVAPQLRNANIERVKMNDQSIEHDSAYSSSDGSSQQLRMQRRTRHIVMDINTQDPNFLDVDSTYDDRSSAGSQYLEPQFALLSSEDTHLPVEEWLNGDLRAYIPKFKKHGYDSIAFISGMQEKDLELIGITKRGHRQKFIREIKRLPKHEIEEDIPDEVPMWLEDLGLEEYCNIFEENGYTEPSDLEDLKKMDKETVKETFKVKKVAHLNMLCQAINKLQYANQGQKRIRNARRELLKVPNLFLEDTVKGREEYDFWDKLRDTCLIPELAGFDGNTELKEKLQEMRNSAVMIFFVANTLWLIVIMVLVRQNELKTLGVDLIGLSFLLVYGTIIILQFLAMIGHRLTTLLHILARAPWTCCRQCKSQNHAHKHGTPGTPGIVIGTEEAGSPLALSPYETVQPRNFFGGTASENPMQFRR